MMMALPYQLPLYRLHSARPASSYPPHVLNMITKTHCRLFLSSRSRRRSADVGIAVKDETTSSPVQTNCIAQEEGRHEGSGIVKDKSVSVVLLAGGKGKRMGEVDESSELVCIHDSARPLVSFEDVKKVLKDAWLNGAAVLGVPVKATIKEANNDFFVVRTLDRKTLWEMQTPQVIKPDLLRAGFELVNQEGLEVTDDVSIVEHLKHPVYITEGSYTNIKVTTPDDLLLAERILNMET